MGDNESRVRMKATLTGAFLLFQCGEKRVDVGAGKRLALQQLLRERRKPSGVIGQKRRDSLIAVGQQARGQRGGVGRGSARAL